MFSKSTNHKVKFQDEQQIDDYILENSVLQSKLQSKMEALSIMNRELDKCSMERDRYKLLVEQLKCKNISPERTIDNNILFRYNPSNTIRGGELLATTRAQNNNLKLEVESLRSKLDEAVGDIKALRKQIKHYEKLNATQSMNIEHTYSSQDYENLVQQLEKMQLKYQQIQLDYRATCDEKEEIISDREYYKSKVQRLNQQISYILTNGAKSVKNNQGDPPLPIVDIDALITENKYLHERITQLQVEKEIIKRTLTKYKTLLENRNKNDSLNLKKGFIDVMTQKQVREFLDKISNFGLKKSSAMELKSLCLGLFEAVNDKSIALQHQRKTNQKYCEKAVIIYENWTVTQLKAELRKRNASTVGKKAALVERLEAYDRNNIIGVDEELEDDIPIVPPLEKFKDINASTKLPAITKYHVKEFAERILANRVSELEKTLESWSNGQKYIPVFPSEMLIEEFLTDPRTNTDEAKRNSKNLKKQFSDSDDDKINSDSSSESRNKQNNIMKYDNEQLSSKTERKQNILYENGPIGSKTVLPFELEELVKEALAELKPAHNTGI